jgi:hypothetical protein
MRKTAVLAVAAAAVLLAACRAEFNVGLDVEEDRSGAVFVEFGTDQELRDSIGSLGGDAGDLTSAFELPAIEGGESYTEERGEMTFQGIRIPFDDIDEIEREISDATESLAQFSSFSFEMDDTSAVFDATTAPSDLGDFGDLPVDPSQFGDFLGANFTLAMPGTVTSHNADEVLADGRLRWNIPLLGGQSDMHAESEFGGSGVSWLFVILGIVLVIGIGAMVAAVVLGKREEKDAVSAAAAAYPAAPSPEPSGEDGENG